MQLKSPIVILLFLLFGLSNISQSQNVNIPDVNFKALLVGNPLINTNGDGEIQVSEATVFAGTIDVSNRYPKSYEKHIYNLIGIEAFRSLTKLDCSENLISSLDVSANNALETLYCNDNPFLKTINLRANPSYLKDLDCRMCGLTSLDLSTNKALRFLHCSGNNLTCLTISGISTLILLDCSYNELTHVDLSGVSLSGFDCSNNRFASLDISAQTALEFLYCNNNQLTSLNAKNGKRPHVWTRDNPNLTCIQVDDVAFSELQFSKDIDPWTRFSETCTVGVNNISNTGINLFPNPNNGIFTISGLPMNKALCIEIYNLLGEEIYSRTISQPVSYINISNSPKGMYFVKVGDGKKIYTNRIEIK